MPAGNLHVTLVFLGAVPETAVTGLCEAARTVAQAGGPAAAPPAIVLDTIEYWRRAQVLCAAASREPRAGALAEALRSGLSAAGFHPDLKPFRAHVTLARQVRLAPPDARMSAVAWTFDGFALMDSRTGPGGPSYSVVESWTLCAAAREK